MLFVIIELKVFATKKNLQENTVLLDEYRKQFMNGLKKAENCKVDGLRSTKSLFPLETWWILGKFLNVPRITRSNGSILIQCQFLGSPD